MYLQNLYNKQQTNKKLELHSLSVKNFDPAHHHSCFVYDLCISFENKCHESNFSFMENLLILYASASFYCLILSIAKGFVLEFSSMHLLAFSLLSFVQSMMVC